MKKSIVLRGVSAVMASLFTLSSFGTSLAMENAGTINNYFNLATTKIETEDNGADTMYYKSEYGELSDENLEKLLTDSYKQCVHEQEEGSVLLKNENSALPLKEDERSVTLFGQASVDPVYKPTSGAAPASGEYLITYHDALKTAGFDINETLFQAYEKNGVKRAVGTESPAYGVIEADLGEADQTFYTDALKQSWEASYNDVAIVMLAREGGEDADLAMNDAEGMSQLALHQEERDLLQMIQDSGKFKKTIVILNSPWAMETGWLDEYEIDACLWIGNTGLRGFEGVANLLTGKANPSGKLTVTYAANSLSAPAVTYASDNILMYENADEVQAICYDDDQYVSYYTIYAEGIYVGYKYYETRYEDCILNRYGASDPVGSSDGKAWNYADEICYPFGFGLSYTEFEQKLESVKVSDDEISVVVSVENVGDTPGKSVVELYAQKPYGTYEIENKVEASAIQIVGYEKTRELQPGEKEEVLISVDPYLLASYDYTNAKGYIVSAGMYYLSIGNDAHDALNNILAAKGAKGMFDQNGNAVKGNAEAVYSWEQEEMNTEKYRYSDVTGAEVTNQFDFANINNLLPDTITYLSRSDWAGTYPVEAVSITATEEMIHAIDGHTYEKPENALSVADYTQGADNGLNFASMKDVDYEDEDTWNQFLDQMTIEELCSILSTDMSGAEQVESIVMPSTTEGDGIDGVKSNFLYGDKRSATAFTGTCVLAATWNRELIEKRGVLMAEEALYCNYPTIWCGGGDLCRTPFSGRNFEYWSEDGTITYLGAATELKAMQEKGLNAGIKHYCGNDQEKHRESLSTFFNEQAWRENNLRAFESSFCDAKILDTMQGFNRIGCVYVGQCSELLINVLRNEWGYKGKVITDAVCGASYQTHYAESISAGTDYYCWDKIIFGEGEPQIARDILSKQIVETDDGALLENVRNAAKHVYYAMSRSFAVNGMNETTKVITVTPWWQSALYVVIASTAVLSVLSFVLYQMAVKKKKETMIVQ